MRFSNSKANIFYGGSVECFGGFSAHFDRDPLRVGNSECAHRVRRATARCRTIVRETGGKREAASGEDEPRFKSGLPSFDLVLGETQAGVQAGTARFITRLSPAEFIRLH